MGRQDFLQAVRAASATGEGFAAGKLGPAALQLLCYPVLRRHAQNLASIDTFYTRFLIGKGLSDLGLFPKNRAFSLEFAERYRQAVLSLDSVGLFYYGDDIERAVCQSLALRNPVHYANQEPGRGLPDDPADCYLGAFAGRRMVIVCPFADLLAERANRQTFEAVWAKTGKRWFSPDSVTAVEFPYGIEPATEKRFGTANALLADITARLDALSYDVALIAAAGLAIPIAAHVKAQGRIALDLGGHLQVLFGVIGKRWREQEEWRETYFTEAWIDMPERYRPSDLSLCDNGAYW